MSLKNSGGLRAALTVAAFYGGGLLSPAAAQAPALKMLSTLEGGQWELDFRDDTPSRAVCVRSGTELIQLQHTDSGCNRFIVDDGASSVTVQYTCRGNGYGRTSVRRESGTLVQIESQGIAGGLPFQFSAEGRKVGACR